MASASLVYPKRLQLPIFPFKEHHYKAGELHFKENTTSYIDLKKVFDDNKASICGNYPELVQITYTTDKTLLHPRTKFGDSLDDFKSVLGNGSTGKQQSKTTIRFKELGRYKNVDWQFQKEWRYWLFMAPLGIGTSSQITPKTTVDLYSLLQDKDARPTQPMNGFLSIYPRKPFPKCRLFWSSYDRSRKDFGKASLMRKWSGW